MVNQGCTISGLNHGLNRPGTNKFLPEFLPKVLFSAAK